MKRIKLDDIDKKAPFEVPEGYFDQLTLEIQSKVTPKQGPNWILLPQVRWALSGSFIILLVSVILLFPKSDTPTADQLLAEISDEDLIEYIDFTGITEYELIEGLEDETIEALWEEDTLDDLNLENLDLEEIISDYEIDNLLQS